ncbi:MAG: hypothetical protein V3S69_02655 [Dehalococcoidales bacterium]
MKEAVLNQVMQLIAERKALQQSIITTTFKEFATSEDWYYGSGNHPSRKRMHSVVQQARGIAEQMIKVRAKELIAEINAQLLALGIEA